MASTRPGSYGTENGSGTAATPSIRCWPITAPASGAAAWSTMVITATALPLRAMSWVNVSVPLTNSVAADAGIAIATLRRATARAMLAARRPADRDLDDTVPPVADRGWRAGGF